MIRFTVGLGIVVVAALAAGAPRAQVSAAPARPHAIAPVRRPVSFQDRLLPAPVGGGFRQPGYWVWCGTVVKGDDGKYHHYASRWPRGLPFGPHWLTNSEVVHSVSSTPEGPYEFVGVALPPRGSRFWDGQMTHNPVVRRIGGKYVIYYTGTTYRGERPSPGNPTTETSPLKLEAHQGERIGIALADSPDGPWRRFDEPILDVRPGTWERYLVSNSSPLVMPDGSILLYYKGVEELRKNAIGVARAARVEGPYERLTDTPFDAGVGAEDPTMWIENGRYHALMLDTDRTYSDKEIYYATSNDGLHWTTEPNPVAIPKDYRWSDGVARRMNSTERPQILVENGVATHVFIATGATIDGRRETWNQAIPIRPESAVPDRAAWWREARLGMLVRWGNGGPPETWNAREYFQAASAAGVKYVVIDAKGVAPDRVAALAAATRQAGLRFGVRYSPGAGPEAPDGASTPLAELLRNCGDAAVVWLEVPDATTRKQSIALEQLVRRLQPGALVNMRVGNGVGDFEEVAGDRAASRLPGRDFEATVPTADAARCIRTLVDVASRGGNSLLDTAADGARAFPPPGAQPLAGIADWMKTYGESVYATSASSLVQPSWGRFTQRGDVLYAHIFDWPAGPLAVPVDGSFVRGVELLAPAGPVRLAWTQASNGSIVVKLPASPPHRHVSVLRVTLQ